jgi:hypothetical protein
MKRLSILFLLLLIIFSGCEKNSESVNGNYDYMHFVRQGGGQIDFNLFSTENIDQIKVILSKYNYRDTTIQFTINKNSENETFFSTFQDAIKGKIQIKGDFQQSTLVTGTWVYIYFVSDNKETEVTNIELRNTLLKVEQIVRPMVESQITIGEN